MSISSILDFLKKANKFSQVTHFVQFSPNLAQMMVRLSLTKVIRWIFDFRKCSPSQPIKIDEVIAKQEVSSYLNASMYRNQTWYISVHPLQSIKNDAKSSDKKQGHISATLWCIKTKFGTWTRDPILSKKAFRRFYWSFVCLKISWEVPGPGHGNFSCQPKLMRPPFRILSKAQFTKFRTHDLQTKFHKCYQMDFWFEKYFVQYSEGISQQSFDVVIPNLLYGLKTPSWGCGKK